MTTPANVASYYGQANWGLRFGVKDALHPEGHRGQDIVHAAHTDVPALRGGVVVNVQYSSVLGTCIVIQVSDTEFDGYAHNIGVLVRPGQRVTQGQVISQTAGYGDAHGSAWAGPHTHLTNSPNGTGIFAGTVRDPLPVIVATLTGTASSGGVTPIPNNGPTYDEDDDMKIITTSAELTTLACPANPSGSDVQWLIAPQFIQRSASAESSATGTNLYGAGAENTHPLPDLEGFQNTLWNHGISPLVVARIKPGQAWSVERGIFDPGADILTPTSKP